MASNSRGGAQSAGSATSGLTSISTSGSRMASRAATPVFVNQAAVVGEDVAIDCPLVNAIGWLKEGDILFMDNITMYDAEEFGESKFQLTSAPKKRRYLLTVRSVDFRDAGVYFCQNEDGHKALAALTVIEPPACFDKRTQLQESERATYTCVVRVKGADSGATAVAWNKPKAAKTVRTNSTDFTIVASDLEYKADYRDNGEALLCFARNPRWNRTLPLPNCSLGILDVRFPPKLVCDGEQTFPKDPGVSFYVFCDVLANPIEDLDSILWYVNREGRPRRVEEFVNLTRVDKSIANGYRTRLNVPRTLVESSEDGTVDFTLKIYYGGQTMTKDVRLRTESNVPMTYVYVGSGLAVVVVVVVCLVCCCWRCFFKPETDDKDEWEKPTSSSGSLAKKRANGHATSTTTRLRGNEIDVKPKHVVEAHYYKRNHEHDPHRHQHQDNQRSHEHHPFGVPKNNEEDGGRRVRFQNNV